MLPIFTKDIETRGASEAGLISDMRTVPYVYDTISCWKKKHTKKVMMKNCAFKYHKCFNNLAPDS